MSFGEKRSSGNFDDSKGVYRGSWSPRVFPESHKQIRADKVPDISGRTEAMSSNVNQSLIFHTPLAERLSIQVTNNKLEILVYDVNHLLDCKEKNVELKVNLLLHNQLIKTLQFLINYATYLDQEWLVKNQGVLFSLGEKICTSDKEMEDYCNFIKLCLELVKNLQDENSVSLLTGFIALPGYELIKKKEYDTKIQNFILQTTAEFSALIDENQRVFSYIKTLNEYLAIEAQNIQICETIFDKTSDILSDFIETNRDSYQRGDFSQEEKKLIGLVCSIELDSAEDENKELEKLLTAYDSGKNPIEPLRLTKR